MSREELILKANQKNRSLIVAALTVSLIGLAWTCVIMRIDAGLAAAVLTPISAATGYVLKRYFEVKSEENKAMMETEPQNARV